MVQTEDTLNRQMLRGYEIRELIGKGGFGEVYRAFQPAIERDVAIKVILPRYANQPEFVRSFETEARLVARLEHPHIVPLFDYWRDPDGAYLVMRWLPKNLRARIEKAALSEEEALKVIEQISAALTNAHRNHVIHRDIKPDNILLDDDGNAYLSDFGIAKIGTDMDKSEEGVATGSPAYMAPEQLMGTNVTALIDVLALGVVLYEMLMGKHPFAGHHFAAMLNSMAHEDLPNLPLKLAHLDPIVQKATSKDPAERYQNVMEMASALRWAIQPDSSRPLIEIDVSALSNPYMGLRPFDEADAENFFGREQLVREMMIRLTEDDPLANFLAVVGPSGSGKSSVVRAGLIPQLRVGSLTGSGNWYIADMVPGDAPLENLASALLGVAIDPPEDLESWLRETPDGLIRAVKSMLPKDNDELLLVIDQFEEVFTMGDDEVEREQFLTLLSVAVTAPEPPLRVIITLRADFYDRPLRYENFGPLMQQRTQVVLPLGTEELRRAIASPAENIGMVVEAGMMEAIIADLRDEPGALPLLQYALTEVFERRDGNRLTLEAYRESGGVSGALARRAQEVFEELTEEEQNVARQIVLRLVSPGDGTEDTRRRALRSELLEVTRNNEAIQTVLDAYGRYRLLTFDVDSITREPTVEVAHEAIIREWQQLRTWLDENRDDLRMQRMLNTLSNEWNEHDRQDDFLMHGTRLAQFEEWRAGTEIALTGEEETFLRESLAARRRAEQEEAERIAREEALERRSRNRLRVLLGFFVVAAVVGALLSAFAFNRNYAAVRNALEAEANARETRAIVWAVTGRIVAGEGDLDLGQALVNTAATTLPELPQVQQAAYEVMYLPGFMRHLPGHSGTVIDLALSPNEQFMVTGGADGQLIVWDASSFEALVTLPTMDMPVTALRFSPDGSRLYVATGRFVNSMPESETNEIIVLDALNGEELERYEGLSDAVQDLQFNADGSRLYVSTFDGQVLIYDPASRELLTALQIADTPIFNLALSPDETQMAVSSFIGQVTLRDMQDGTERAVLEHGDQSVTAVLFLNNAQLLTGSSDNLIRRWDISDDTPTVIQEYTGHTAQVLAMQLDIDARLLYSADFNGTVLSHHLETGQLVGNFGGEGASIFNMRLSPDGKTLITVGLAANTAADASGIGLWRPDNTAIQERLQVTVDESDYVSAPLYLDSELLLAGTIEGRILNINPHSGEHVELAHYTDFTAFRAAALSPDGRFAAFGGGRAANSNDVDTENPIILWDVENNHEVARLDGHTDAVVALAYSKSSGYLISGSLDNSVRVWDTESAALVTEYPITFQVMALSPDDEQLFVVSQDGSAVLIDLTGGEFLARYDINTGQGNLVRTAAWHPFADIAVVSLSDGTLISLNPRDGVEPGRSGSRGIIAEQMQFSADGLRLVTADSDSVIRVRNMENGDLLESRAEHNNQINSLTVTADGRILSTALDGDIMLWRLDTTLESLLAWASENRSIRDLTCAERDEYNVEPACDTFAEDGTAEAIEMGTVAAGIHEGSFEIGGGNIWLYEGTAGEVLSLRAGADTPANDEDDQERRVELGMLDTRMAIFAPDGDQIADNDDIANGVITDSFIESVTLPEDGTYRIEIRSFDDGTGGAYTFFIGTEASPMPTVTPLAE